MASKQLTSVLRHVRGLIGMTAAEDLTDGQLLERFCQDCDEASFAVLVRRHGPLVQRVCRRVLNDSHAAEDAFQATFLVLARKAATIRQRSSIAGWLYEVAYHLSLRARGNAARRKIREKEAGEMPRVSEDNDQSELRELLDAELQQLPEKYRTPLVLCYLEGKTNEEAAQQLGWPAGSMSCRLARARELLRERLTGRGVALTPAGMALLLTGSAATAGVAEALVDTAVKAAVPYAAGSALAAGAVSAEAIALAEGAFQTMVTTKLKIAAALLLAGLVGTGARVAIQADAAEQPVAAPSKAADDKAGKTDTYGDPLPAGAVMRLGTLRWRHSTPVMFVAYAGDGKEVLTVTFDGTVRVWDQGTGKELRKFGGAAKPNPDVAPPNVPRPAPAEPAAPRPINYAPAGISCATLSGDARTLAIGYQDGRIGSWDVATGKERKAFAWNAPPGDKKPVDPKAMAYMGPVSSMVLSSDAKTVLARCPDNVLRTYDLAEGKEVQKFGTPGANRLPNQEKFFNLLYSPGSFGFSADGKSVIAIGYEVERVKRIQNLVLKVWEAGTGKELDPQKGPDGQNARVNFGSIAPDGKTAAFFKFGQPPTLILWDLAAGKELRKVETGANMYPNMMNFSGNSKSLALRTQDDSIRVYDVASGKETQHVAGSSSQFGPASSNLAFSADGSLLVTGTNGNTVRQFDVANGKELTQSSGHHGSVVALAASADGKTVVTRGGNNSIHVWDAATGKEAKRFTLPAGTNQIAFSADGSMMAIASQDFQKGAAEVQLGIWDVKEGKELRQWKVGQNGLNTLALSPDGKTVASRDYTNAIKLWDAAKGTELKTVAEGPKNAGGNDNIQLAAALRPGWGFGMNQGLIFSPDSTLLAGIGTDGAMGGVKPGFDRALPVVQGVGTLRIWDVGTGKVVRKFDPSKTGFSSFGFSADGRTLATINYDNTISLWEAASGKERFNFALGKANNQGRPIGPQPVPFPAEKAALADKAAVAEDFALRIAPPFPNNQSNATCLAYSPDSRCIATGGSDGVVRMWDVGTGKEVHQFKGHDGAVSSIAFAANGKRLVSGSADTTALIWDTPATAPQANLEIDATRADALWADLASGDATKAYQAIVAFRAGAKTAVPFLKERVKAVPAPDPKKLEQLIADLDSNQFATRTKANDELEKMGKLAKGALDQAMATGPNLEMRQRLERLLEKLVTGAAPPPEQLRIHRSLEVLEWIGTPEARDVLQSMAKGAAGADLTVDAKTSLDRMAKR